MKHNKVITISPTLIVTVLIVFLMLVTAGFIIWSRLPALFQREQPGMSAENAARTGLEAFLSVDAKTGQSAWVDSICKLASDAGCKMVTNAYAPMFWPSVEKDSLRLTCKTASATLVTKLDEPVKSEIWELKTICTNLDSGEANTSSTQVIVVESADAGWKFERVRFDQESGS